MRRGLGPAFAKNRRLPLSYRTKEYHQLFLELVGRAMRAGIDARRFRVKASPKPASGKGWASSAITIFDGAAEIGAYDRNYPSFGEETFEPFEQDGAWYALYSRDYTATRIMSLPDCRDLGGEAPGPNGFCPVEFYVPRYKLTVRINKNGQESERWVFEAEAEKYTGDIIDSFDKPVTVGPWQSLNIGFVAGCLWGDDSSWKLEVIDLSRVSEGFLSRTARFGHLQLARKKALVEAVRLYRNPPAPLRATILQQQDWDVATGNLIDPY